jgi:hypothetical protein
VASGFAQGQIRHTSRSSSSPRKLGLTPAVRNTALSFNPSALLILLFVSLLYASICALYRCWARLLGKFDFNY